MEDYRHTPFIVTNQGAVEVDKFHSQVWVRKDAGDLILLSLDCDSKYPEILTYGEEEEGVAITLYASENTIKLKEGVSPDEPTILLFPEFRGFQVIMAQVTGRYTISILLGKNL